MGTNKQTIIWMEELSEGIDKIEQTLKGLKRQRTALKHHIGQQKRQVRYPNYREQ